MRGEDIVIKANPLSSGTPVVSDLAGLSGVDQGTVAAKLDAEIRSEQDKRMMSPGSYDNMNEPYDVVKYAAEKVKADLMHPEVEFSDDVNPSTTEQAPGANEFSAMDMNNWDEVADWANSMNPENNDLTGATIGMNEQADAGSVNGDSDMTNQSLDFINSIEPTPEQPGPEVDVVPNADETEPVDETGEVTEGEEDPSESAGDGI